jgi:hypothetical protein
MKWLLGLMLFSALVVTALLVPIQGRSLWARGAVREVAHFVAHGMRAGWDAFATVSKGHQQPTHAPATHSPKPKPTAKAQASAAPRTSREGIVPQPPKEKLGNDDKAALEALLRH